MYAAGVRGTDARGRPYHEQGDPAMYPNPTLALALALALTLALALALTLAPSARQVYIFCTSKSIRNFVADGSINTDGSIITDGSKAMGGKVFMGGKVMGGKAFKTLKRLRTISHLGVTDLETVTLKRS